MRPLLEGVVLLTLAACQTGTPVASSEPASTRSSALYKYAGSKQCFGGGTTLQALQRELAGKGIRVLASSCGTDGRVYAATCGAPDGRIIIFEVPANQAAVAQSLGFAPLATLPEASRVACR